MPALPGLLFSRQPFHDKPHYLSKGLRSRFYHLISQTARAQRSALLRSLRPAALFRQACLSGPRRRRASRSLGPARASRPDGALGRPRATGPCCWITCSRRAHGSPSSSPASARRARTATWRAAPQRAPAPWPQKPRAFRGALGSKKTWLPPCLALPGSSPTGPRSFRATQLARPRLFGSGRHLPHERASNLRPCFFRDLATPKPAYFQKRPSQAACHRRPEPVVVFVVVVDGVDFDLDVDADVRVGVGNAAGAGAGLSVDFDADVDLDRDADVDVDIL